jgi:DNA-binding CsgD family transcriptional regulator
MAKEHARRYPRLSVLELGAISLVVAGYTDRELALKLGISERHTRRLLTKICGKLGAYNRIELVLIAIYRRLIDWESAHTSARRARKA